jgi:hypothetical protein
MAARMMTRSSALTSAAFALASLGLAACAPADDAAPAVAQSTTAAFGNSVCASRQGGALVTIAVSEDHPETFTAWVTNPDFIAEAKRLLADNERGTPNFKFIDGTDCDDQWSFHVDPADAEFPWGTIEICDAMPSYVDQNKGEWIEKNLRWCPWGSRVLEVVEQ